MHTDWNCFNTWTFGSRLVDHSSAGVVLPTDAQHPSWLHKLTNERQSEKNDQNIHYFQLACSPGLCQLHKRKRVRFDREISNCGQQDGSQYYQWRAVPEMIRFQVSSKPGRRSGTCESFPSSLLFKVNFSKQSGVGFYPKIQFNRITFGCLQSKTGFIYALKLREPCPKCLRLCDLVTLYAKYPACKMSWS